MNDATSAQATTTNHERYCKWYEHITGKITSLEMSRWERPHSTVLFRTAIGLCTAHKTVALFCRPLCVIGLLPLLSHSKGKQLRIHSVISDSCSSNDPTTSSHFTHFSNLLGFCGRSKFCYAPTDWLLWVLSFIFRPSFLRWDGGIPRRSLRQR